ncbi:unnamed protein product [Tilletia controversa]|uniref:OPT family small oligopeptide transporter n=3 Tax=Tilletia TaxID=13289 RepID=A0A8X7MYH3_9BASI|nr:hypothetical protein CF336_g4598 [Tilletia laevis]KAE8203346.1 hypothetical protein CF328_g1703 [Tilletia controversa]KAE8259588.1 hypothetical protein A4X03_0g4057 [Tilletia caries]KAE8201686.1 hypothetical protein CF335_g3687 [Tilletia laevis]KAE8252721.1 hypothetical protein A4X06_0g1978 [Tilletia controversa]
MSEHEVKGAARESIDHKSDSGASIPAQELEKVEADLHHSIISHRINDPNLDPALIDQAESALEKGDVKAELKLEDALHDDSIYPEVRVAVSNVDDPNMPVNTFRTWFIGLVFTILLSGLNQFFSYRIPSVQISSLVAQLVAFPFGVLLAAILPRKVWKTPLGSFSLNPGPFNIKEHTMITVMANVTAGGAYATDVLAVQKFFYNQSFGAGYQIMLVMSTQLIGFSYAGFCRRWLVWPAAMIWPANLVQTALLTTLHHTRQAEPGRMSRERFFVYAFLASFVWYFFPGYIFTALSYFNWACWIAPNNIILNQLMGVNQGLGMGILTFDWSQISYVGSPLITPWFTEAQTLFSLVFFYWFISPILYYNNVKNGSYLPMLENHVFDRFGERYNVSAAITPEGTFDLNSYNEYSQQFLPIPFMMSYGLSFASVTSILVHVYLYHGKEIVSQFKSSLKNEPDIHARLMSRYKEVPNAWYLATFLISVALGFAATLAWPTFHPWWALILALVISALYTLPIGIIQAITNQQVGLNVITEFIIGYAVPGHPVAMMIFKTYGYITMAQALSFVSDLKLGHYMKIPPRDMFIAQTVSTILSVFVLLGVQSWVFNNVEGVCTSEAVDHFVCPGTTVFGTASVIWGLIGPKLNFSPGQYYSELLWMFLVGALAPIPTFFLAKRYPRSWLRYVSWPVIFTSTGLLPPASGVNYISYVVVGFIFQYYLRRKHFGWWSSYNYVLSAALDAGTGISIVFIFFVLIFPKGKQQAFNDGNWWGNTVWVNTADAEYTPYLNATALVPDGFALAPGGTKYAAS